MKQLVSLVCIATGAAALVRPAPATAECRRVEVQLTPEAGLQLAAWVEAADGTFVTTLFVTRATGTYGLGNRPGRFDFNTNYLWPYGRRDGVLPVWAHRRGVTYPSVRFQNTDDSNLSHPAGQSSEDAYYCKPMAYTETDGITCSTSYVGTDKGVFHTSETSLYPPRQDIVRVPAFDHEDVDMFAAINDLDAVSRATPPGGQPFVISAVLPPGVPAGDYFVFVEAHLERDYNDDWNPATHPGPTGIPFAEFGDPVRGQPSIVWKVPITLETTATTGLTMDFAGYGDIDGASGMLFAPDATISTVPGTFVFDQDGAGARPPVTYDSFGAARLQLVSGPEGMYRVRATAEVIDDVTPPGPITGLEVDGEITGGRAVIRFVNTGDDGDAGMASELEVRMRAGAPLTEATFTDGLLVAEGLTPGAAGSALSFELEDLLPETRYWVGVRAKDECLSPGAAQILEFVTPAAVGSEVDVCFVATAAWGSLMGGQVTALRAFRDRVLRRQIVGELFVQAYYHFGPVFAEIIEPSGDLRALARAALAPLTDAATGLPSR